VQVLPGRNPQLASEHDSMKAGIARLRSRFNRVLWASLLYTMAAPFALSAPTAETKLTSAQIRATIGGHHVSDGRHWSHDYFADGRLERQENGRTRVGHWNIQNNQLCLLLPEISKESPVCFDVVRVGKELQYRDAGQVVYQGSVRGASSQFKP